MTPSSNGMTASIRPSDKHNAMTPTNASVTRKVDGETARNRPYCHTLLLVISSPIDKSNSRRIRRHAGNSVKV
jgi:hypothetical protein